MTGKAVGTMTVANSYTGEVIPADTLNIVPLMDRRVHVRSLLPQGTTNSDVVRIPKETGGEGAVNITAEAGTKPAVDFDIATTDYNVYKIAGRVVASEEILNDTAGLQSFIVNRLTNKYRNKEDQQLLYGTGSSQIEGLTVNAATFTAVDPADTNATIVDLIIQAAAQLENAEYMANGMLLNPTQYAQLVRSKDADGQYVKNAFWDSEINAINVYGIPVYKNTAVTNNDYIIGDWTNSAQIFDRQGLRIDFSTEDGTNFQENLVTIRIEGRLTLGKFYNEGFIYGDVSDDLAKLVAGS
jgi:HK97 family phage major capsid protein